MKQKIDLNKMGLLSLDDLESQTIEGGLTTFAYDIASFLRFSFFGGLGVAGVSKAASTYFNWKSQQ